MGCQLQHGHTHGAGSGHGHSHGIPIENLQSPKGGSITMLPRSISHIGETPKTSRSNKNIECTSANAVCPISPSERLEDGAADLIAVDTAAAAAAAGGSQPYSYQNSRSIGEVRAAEADADAAAAAAAAKQDVNMNVRAAYIHVIGDMIQSVGVFIAALVIFFKPTWVIIDPICTFIFSVIVLFTTFSILKDALLVLMEGTPSYTNYQEVLAIFQQIEGVERVHNLRIWALSINKIALSVHLAIGPGANPKTILQEANRAVHLRYNLFETTIQIEDLTPQMEDCQQCNVPET